MFQILGDENISEDIKAKQELFRQRNIFVDCRGTLKIHETASFGFNIRIYTQSHDINDFKKTVNRPVIIERNAFIGSDCILYNCTIKEHSIVSVGTIVKNMVVPAGTIVSGNPPQIIAIWDALKHRWQYLTIKKETGG